MMQPTTLRVFRYQSPVKVLGPLQRAVIWVQGCSFQCPGCIVPESWNPQAGEEIAIAELVDWVLSQPEIEGITLSGGEPMLQAAELVALIDAVQAIRPLGVMCYSGYRFEQLQQGSPAQQALLQRIDLLVDGQYVKSLHADRLWRGSSNQRLLLLSDRYHTLVHDRLTISTDRSAGLEFNMSVSGDLSFTGVPPQPEFRAEFELRMQHRGIVIQAQS